MHRSTQHLTELAGLLAGATLAPFVGLGARLRRARPLHPRGTCFTARVEPVATTPDLVAVGERLAGNAFVRLSSALWRGQREAPDVLGCALRFRGELPALGPVADGDQDLLLATIPRPYLTPLGFAFTHPHDYLDNLYWAVSPFAVGGRRLWLRARARGSPDRGHDGGRAERLAQEVRAGTAILELEASSRPWRGYAPVARVWLLEPIDLDQHELAFSPFRAGRGLRPVGFVHALRVVTYAASQRVRSRERVRREAGVGKGG
jgi:hypothetical protein